MASIKVAMVLSYADKMQANRPDAQAGQMSARVQDFGVKLQEEGRKAECSQMLNSVIVKRVIKRSQTAPI